MWFFHQRFNLSPRQRRIVMGLAMILCLTSTRVQAAEVNAMLPADAADVITMNQQEDDAASRGIRVPVGLDIQPFVTKTSVPAITAAQVPATTVVRELRVTATAYNSVPGQTDSTPFITADGSRTRDGIVAANFLKFGTKVKFPDLFGDKVFEVHDRMNARYPDRIDIWMARMSDSLRFGVKQNVRVQIVQ